MSFVKVCTGKYDNTDALEKELHYCAQNVNIGADMVFGQIL